MIHNVPADIDIGEWNGQDKDDGAEVVVLDWGEQTIVIKKDAAVDTAFGVLHLAGETLPAAKESVLDPKGMFVGFTWATLLTVWVWICWNAMTWWIG